MPQRRRTAARGVLLAERSESPRRAALPRPFAAAPGGAGPRGRRAARHRSGAGALAASEGVVPDFVTQRNAERRRGRRGRARGHRRLPLRPRQKTERPGGPAGKGGRAGGAPPAPIKAAPTEGTTGDCQRGAPPRALPAAPRGEGRSAAPLRPVGRTAPARGGGAAVQVRGGERASGGTRLRAGARRGEDAARGRAGSASRSGRRARPRDPREKEHAFILLPRRGTSARALERRGRAGAGAAEGRRHRVEGAGGWRTGTRTRRGHRGRGAARAARARAQACSAPGGMSVTKRLGTSRTGTTFMPFSSSSSSSWK